MIAQILALSNPLRPLENFLEDALIWLHTSAGFSWAWSIVALTVIVRVLLVPVTAGATWPGRSWRRSAPCAWTWWP